jgi:hypothetical protein
MVEHELTFDAVLAVVQGLIGESVVAEIENPATAQRGKRLSP